MNHPTREEFNELKAEVRKLKEQRTEEIKVTRVEIDPGIHTRLDNHTEMLKEISTKQDEQEQQLTLLFTDVGHMKTDIGVLKQTAERLETKMDNGFQDVQKRFDAMAEVYKLILARLPEKGE
jgi:chromosome segregation ATPase